MLNGKLIYKFRLAALPCGILVDSGPSMIVFILLNAENLACGLSLWLRD